MYTTLRPCCRCKNFQGHVFSMAVTAPRMWGILQFFLSPETCLRRPGKQLSDLFCLKRGIVGNMECLDFIVSIHPWSNHKPLLQRAPITSFHTWFTYIFIICFTREGGLHSWNPSVFKMATGREDVRIRNTFCCEAYTCFTNGTL